MVGTESIESRLTNMNFDSYRSEKIINNTTQYSCPTFLDMPLQISQIFHTDE